MQNYLRFLKYNMWREIVLIIIGIGIGIAFALFIGMGFTIDSIKPFLLIGIPLFCVITNLILDYKISTSDDEVKRGNDK